jgi:hypothetical protein
VSAGARSSSCSTDAPQRGKDGRVQRKNRHRPTGHEGYVLDRESPGRGFQHVVAKRDVQAFIDIVPAWDRFSERLERIVLAAPSDNWDGAYEFFHREETGAIYLHAWREASPRPYQPEACGFK